MTNHLSATVNVPGRTERERNSVLQQGVVFIVAGALSLAMASTAVACQGKTIIFEDTFTDDASGWDSDKAMETKDSRMQVQMPTESTVFRELNGVFFVKNADICVEAVWPTALTELNPSVGIMFWAPNYTIYKSLSVSGFLQRQCWTVPCFQQRVDHDI